VPTIVGQQCEVILECRRGNEEVKITYRKTGCPQPAAFSPNDLARCFIDTEYREAGGEKSL
jgi:hypothetical protein